MSGLPTNRRTALTAAGATGAGLVLAACGGASGGRSVTDSGGEQQEQAPAPPSGTRLAALDDVPVGGAISVTGPDEAPMLVVRPAESEAVAFSAKCPHQGCTVEPAGEQLNCPCHQSKFDMTTGKRLAGPAQTGLSAVPVRVDGGNVVTGKA